MDSERRLKIKLSHGWVPVKDAKAYICVRKSSAEPGELQFSSALYKPAGPLLKPVDVRGLVDLCRKMANGIPDGKEILSQSGDCDFGIFATVAVRGSSPARFQVWVLSNGRDFILVTHDCPKEPDPVEVKEANEIALMARLE